MKTIYLFTRLWVGACFLLVSQFAQAQLIGLDNAYETTGAPILCTDDVFVTLEMYEPNSCTTYNSYSVSSYNGGNQITITINSTYTPPPPDCFFFVNYFTETAILGKFPPGTYTVKVVNVNPVTQFPIQVVSTGTCKEPSVIDVNHSCFGNSTVCGCDGVSYADGCTAFYKHGVTSWTNGACANSCVSNPVVPAISGATTICAGASTTLTASATGSTGPYTYTWSNSTSGATNNVSPAATSTYTVTVTSNAACTATATHTVTVLPPVSVGNVTTDALTGTFTVSGGLPQTNGSNYASVTMALQGNPGVTATLTTAPFIHNETVHFTAPQAGTYNVVVTDGSGCSSTKSITVAANTGACAIYTILPNPVILGSICATTQIPSYLNAVESTECFGNLVLSQSPVPGTLLSTILGPNPVAGQSFLVTITGQDGPDVSTTSFTVVIQDGSAPVPSEYFLAGDTSYCGSYTTNAPQATAPCNPAAPVMYGVPSTPAATLIPGTPPQYVFPVGNYLVTWTYTDASNNVATQLQTISVLADVFPAVAQCQTGISVTLDAGGQASLPAAAVDGGSYDPYDCGPVSLSLAPNAFTTADIGTVAVTLTATDAAGNTATCSTQITVVDFPGSGSMEPPCIEWQKVLGGSGHDVAKSIKQTTDGGFIIAGNSDSNDGDITGSHGSIDGWVVKLSMDGNIEWQKVFGGIGDDYLESIQQTMDGGYIIAGYSDSNDGDVVGNHGAIDYWVMKLNAFGVIEWGKTLGGSNNDLAYSVQQTTDGGFIITGESASNDGDVIGNHGPFLDVWVVKLTISGSLQWQIALGGSDHDFGNSVQETTDGGFILASHAGSNDGDVTGQHGSQDLWVVKLNSFGIIQWQKALGGSSADGGFSIRQTNDGGFIIAGHSASNDGDVSGNHGANDIWIVKLNAIGASEWQNAFGGSSTDLGFSIQQINDGGFVVAGVTTSNDGNVNNNHGFEDFWVIKVNAFGILEWEKTLGGSHDDRSNSIQQTNDGGFIAAGETYSNDGDVSGNHGYSDIWVVKLNTCPTLTCTTVTTTSDTGPGSLRSAINCANTNPGPDTIRFEIPGAGPHVISLLSALPTITDNGTVIDATTQPNWSLGKIIVDGAGCGASAALTVQNNAGFELYGLVMKNTPANAALELSDCDDVRIGAAARGNAIYGNAESAGMNQAHQVVLQNVTNGFFQGNIIGLTENYTAPSIGYNTTGLAVEGLNIQIGGSRNLNEGNTFGQTYFGTILWDLSNGFTPGNINIWGNIYGTSASGGLFGGNDGIEIEGGYTGVEIGGSTDHANIFKNYAEAGVYPYHQLATSKVNISQNQFSCNAAGIGLFYLDPMQEPVIASATPSAVSGTAPANAQIEVYTADEACPNAACQGWTYLGATQANAGGQWSLAGSFVAGTRVTATATLQYTSLFSACATVQGVTLCPSDSLALIALYNATNGPAWTNTWNLSQPMSTWPGVSLSASGCVDTLLLPGNNLAGSLPAELGDLSELVLLNLASNQLTGSIPPELGQLSNLHELNLSQNQLTGAIPPSLGQLTALLGLYLNENQLDGSIPATLTQLAQLQYLNLSKNGFSGALPAGMNNLAALKKCFLNNNQLNGNIPAALGQLSQLQFLNLSINEFSGSIPPALSNLTSIDSLFLNQNLLTGCLDPLLKNLCPGNVVSIASNPGLATQSWANFCNNDEGMCVSSCDPHSDSLELVKLYNATNGAGWTNNTNWLVPGKAISEWFGITMLNGCIRQINLQANGLTGTIPNLNLPSIHTISLSFNQLSGEIPNFDLPNLWWLDLSRNNLSGPIPPFQLPKMGLLDLYQNQLSGLIPDFDMPEIWWLELSDNQLSGAIPQLNADNLTEFHIYDNQLTFSGLPYHVNKNYQTFYYSPQDSVFADTVITRLVGQPLVIDIDIDDTVSTNVYHWLHNNTPIATITGDNTFTFNALALTDAGEYRVQITNPTAPDLTLYSRKITLNVTSCATANQPVIAGPTALCGGSAVLQTGSFAQYIWSNNATTPDITVTLPGTYTVTVTDANGCTGTDTQTVGASVPAPAPVITGPTALCSGSATLLTGNFSQYLWSNSAATPSINVTQTGAYTVTVTDANGCTGTDTQTVGASVPSPAPVITGPTALCSGSATLLTGVFSQYLWSNSAATPSINVTQTGTYTVTVTDANGCTGTDTQTVGASVPAPAPVITGPAALCHGSATLQTGSFAQYLWSNGLTTSGINITQAGVYTVTVTNANGCTGTAVKTVAGNATPVAQLLATENSGITGDFVVCAGDDALFTAAGGIQYQFWVNGVAQTPGFVPGNTLSLSSLQTTTTVQVVIMDLNACTDTTQTGEGIAREPITMTIAPAPNLGAFASALLPACPEDPVQVSLQAPDLANGTYSVQYKVNNGVTQMVPVAFSGGTGVLSLGALSPQTGAVCQILQLGQVSSGCSAAPATGNTLTFNVPAPFAATVDTTICDQQIIVIGGQTYSQAGTYTIPLTTAAGCDSTLTLKLHTVPQFTRTDNATICTGDQYNFYGNLLSQQGTYQHVSIGSSGCDTLVQLILFEKQPTLANVSATTCPGTPYAIGDSLFTVSGFYQVTLTSALGCDSIVNLNLQVSPIALSFPQPEVKICQGENAVLAPLVQSCQNCQYHWSTGATQSGITVNPGVSTTYGLTITGGNNCTVTAMVAVAVQPAYDVEQDMVICPGDTILAGGQTITKPGTYHLDLQTVNGCDSTISLTLSSFDASQLVAAPDTVLLPPDGSTTRDFNVSDNDFTDRDYRLEVVQQPTQGNVEVLNKDELRYMLTNPDFYGYDSLQYQLCPLTDCPETCTLAWVYVRAQAGTLEEAKKHISNVITPNEDGFNDTFDPVQVLLDNGIEIEESELFVMNRWGETVFHQSRGYGAGNAWNGKQEDRTLPQATYYYRLRVVSGDAFMLKGPVNLLR